MKRKTRHEKLLQYDEKYGEIPNDHYDRLQYISNELGISNKQQAEIMEAYHNAIDSTQYSHIRVILYEEPEGAPRPRFQLVNRYNLANAALSNGSFVKVYSPTGLEDNSSMRRMIDSGELNQIQQMLYTPTIVEFNAYLKTPQYFNKKETALSEVGLIRPLSKPDWDNIGKKYSDMFNANIWLDDTLVIDGSVRRFYSVKPRVEIDIYFMDKVYTKKQAKGISKSLENQGIAKDIDYIIK